MIPADKIKSNRFLLFLLGYHLIFTYFSWDYFVENGGDAAFYWFQTEASRNRLLCDLFHYGSDVILLFNYFFANILHLDIVFGFLLYSLIGFLGILQFYRLGKALMNGCTTVFGIDFLFLLLLLPNLHFWTATLGKEPVCFLLITAVLLEICQKKYFSIKLIVAFLLLMAIRPHIALFLLTAVMFVFFFGKQLKPMQKLLSGLVFLIVAAVAGYMVLQLSEIRYPDWERIRYFNEYSLLSFRDSGSYVPMLDYSYPYRLFTFWFRPFPGEFTTFLGWGLALENIVWLLLHLTALFLLARKWQQLHFTPVMKIILLFAVISAVIIVQRYAGFGIFARTKIMLQPFTGLVLLWILTFVPPQTEKNT
ncbi:hypothetical protein [Flavobacterium suncheonense]|uniref:Glycosyltransferase RgtA/B/C/D-like domain-containing protein n=1 Tax=Flavobacterium suncheonense GH29-5 = DSM 17707 TaxID=1121899 RepID=A0A0A2MAT8_9FLAO|nr:hypothetical protein [Flavobacterium suncheonense]KGO89384.1 hypothetical protein Q764_08370 [Flavobacterium suncheonense GH29-5 = DSM 17707]